MTPQGWPCPLPGGATAEELALCTPREGRSLVLIVPALFDEANRMRRLTVETMRRLEAAGIAAVLIDLPGTNESLIPLESLSLDDWRAATMAAATHFGATHCLAIRGGALVAPPALPGWHYAPAKGASLLRQMLRARILTDREAGREETQDSLLTLGKDASLELSGHRLSAAMLDQLGSALPAPGAAVIDQEMIGGGPLWLRAEPDDDADQADALAAVIAVGIAA